MEQATRPPLRDRLNSRTVYLTLLVLALVVWLRFEDLIDGAQAINGILGDLAFYGAKGHMDKRIRPPGGIENRSTRPAPP